MKKNTYNTPPFSCLTFADGQKFLLHPTDTQAAEIVARITDVMHLSPGSDGREIFVCIVESPVQERFPKGKGPLVCCLSPGGGVAQMSQLARFIAAQTMPLGGMLIHGGLIMHQGQGIILAAPGGTGKSTACNRLPEFWEVLSDDAVLVVVTKGGRYFAHPWPTWSRLFDGGLDEDWNVEEAVPLSAVFFLQQSPVDQVEPLPRGNAVSFVIESIRQMMLIRRMDEHQSEVMEELLNICLPGVERIVNSVPIYILKISLYGTFWEKITRTLQNTGECLTPSPICLTSLPLDTSCNVFNEKSIPIIYSGSSMNPTFRDADLLEVVPLGTRPYRVGDVICFNLPKKDKYFVHRIVAILKNGIRTRGDNNTAPDPELVQPDEIIGKVVKRSRAPGTRKVTGGTAGITLHMLLLARKMFLKMTDSPIKTNNPIGLSVHFIRHSYSRILPHRYVMFSTRNSCVLRLYLGSHLAGEYNTTRRTWMIRSQFSLFIDKKNLPIVECPCTISETPEGTQ